MNSHVLYTSQGEIRRNQGDRVLKFRFFKRCCCSSNAYREYLVLMWFPCMPIK